MSNAPQPKPDGFKRGMRRGTQCFILHTSGKESRVYPRDFFDHLRAGNLIQTAEQKQHESNKAWVLPGLVVRFSEGSRTMNFEVAQRMSAGEIARRLERDFGFSPEKAREVAWIITTVRSLRLGERNFWFHYYVAHLLKSYPDVRLSELAERMRQVQPRIVCEPIADLRGRPILSHDPFNPDDLGSRFCIW